MKISNPLWAVWCIIVESRRGWYESCRLPLSCVLLLSLYWEGEVILIWGWYNGPEVTGDLMRGTWHWNVLCANAILPMQMTVKWRRVQGWKTCTQSSTLIEITANNRSSDAFRCIYFDQCLHFPLVPWKNFPEPWEERVGGVTGSRLLSYWCDPKGRNLNVTLSVVMIYLYWTIHHQKEICGQWTLR